MKMLKNSIEKEIMLLRETTFDFNPAIPANQLTPLDSSDESEGALDRRIMGGTCKGYN